MNDPSELFDSEWKELRTEVTSWEAVDEELRGYDGYTRYWCKKAVLGVFWIAEQDGDGPIEIMLTTDIDLEGFKTPLPFPADEDLKLQLAQHVGWQETAVRVVSQMIDKQLPLFDGV